MHLRHSFDSIEPIKFEISTIERLREIAVAREILLLDLEISGPTATVIHVIGSVYSRTNIEPGLRVFRVALSHVEFRLFLIARVLRMGIHPLALKSLPYDLTLDQFFSAFEVSKRAHYLGVGGDYIFLEVDVLGPQIVLHPRRTVLLVGRVVETALSGFCEGALSRHMFYL